MNWYNKFLGYFWMIASGVLGISVLIVDEPLKELRVWIFCYFYLMVICILMLILNHLEEFRRIIGGGK